MLSYLDDLCEALLARESEEVRRLLALPAAASLPPDVRAEAQRGTNGHPPASWVPLHTLRFAHAMAHLEGGVADPAVPDHEPALLRTPVAV